MKLSPESTKPLCKPMKKPVIAVDCDEVLLPLHEPLLMYHNKVYGTNFVHPDTQGRYYLEHFTGEPYDQVLVKLKTYVDTPAFIELQPIPGAIKAIKKLSKKYNLIVITARQDFMEEVTRRTLETHFGSSFDDIHFTAYKGGGKHATKLDLCQQHKVNYLIDDNAHTISEVAEAGINGILFGEYEWNRLPELPKGAIRCGDWESVLEYFDA
jgi:5'(3')-deoxyribonucleotidase